MDWALGHFDGLDLLSGWIVNVDLSGGDVDVAVAIYRQSFPALFGIYATCMDAAVEVLGVEYAIWSLMLFALLGVLALLAIVRTRRA